VKPLHAALPCLQGGLGERQHNDLAGYRLAHAASSSGVFQSLASADSLSSSPQIVRLRTHCHGGQRTFILESGFLQNPVLPNFTGPLPKQHLPLPTLLK
jgi:hypothetical protein